jgi:G8 domain
MTLSRRSPMSLLAFMATAVWCAAAAAADSHSVRSGAWSDPATWSTGRLPGAADAVTIAAGHTVTYDLASSRVAGVRIEAGAALAFEPGMDATLETSANVIALGTLRLRPQEPAGPAHRNSARNWGPYFIHTLRFVEVDETKFVGGGMEPVESDVGLWVVGAGVLDIAGAPKTGWVRLAGSALQGDDTIALEEAPIGWRNGDTIAIAPTEHPDVGERAWAGFEVRTVAAAEGATMRLDAPLAHDHPAVDDPFSGEAHTAEVLNLSRNVRIEGTGDGSARFQPSDNGRAHIFILSAVPQSVRYAELVLLGPRGPDERDPTHGVQGRYPLHFHHNGDASQGSLVEGVVVRQSGNRAFVPHASHGITFRDTIAYDVWEDPYWWDERTPNQTHDTVFERAIAAVVQDDPDHRGYTLSGFVLGEGRNNSITNSVAVGIRNKGSGFQWPSGANGAEYNVWRFANNAAHNNKPNGIFVWQNDDSCHVIEDFVAFRNGRAGVNHGAYNNDFVYADVVLFENEGGAIRQHAGPKSSEDCVASDGYAMAWRGLKSDRALRFDSHSQPWGRPLLVKDCVLGGVIVNGGQNPTLADFVDCARPDGADLAAADFDLVKPVAGMTIRVQRRDGTAFRLDHLGNVTPIAAFYGAGADGGDTAPPAAPSGLTATGASATRVDLSWTAAGDDVGVTGYRIYRDGSSIAIVGGAAHSDLGLAAATAYRYEVAALDAAGNESQRSAPAAAKTLAAGSGPPPPAPENLRPLAQASVTLLPAADTYLQEGRPTEAGGEAAEVSIDASARGGETQGLLRFDLSEIPAGSEVASAILTIQTTDSGKGADFHRMLVTWNEDATWESMGAGIAADDAEAASSADLSTGGVDDGPATFDATTPVQAWVDGAPNHGWVLLPLGSNGWDFATRESAAPPQLTVTFVPPSG